MSLPLFQRLLGDAWPRVPEAIRAMHTFSSVGEASGRCSVDRGSSVVSNCIAALFGFPRAAEMLPVTVRFTRERNGERGGERWIRTFGRQALSSSFRAGSGRSKGLLCERFGAIAFVQALVLDDDRLLLVMRRWTLFGIALPFCLAPRSNSYETVEDGKFHFHVEISLPIVGLLIRYRGWLV